MVGNYKDDYLYFDDMPQQQIAEPPKKRTVKSKTKFEKLVKHASADDVSKSKGKDEFQEVFCICRGPDDGVRPMIQCDICTEWFHFDCVGLDPNSVPDEYVCAKCERKQTKFNKQTIKAKTKKEKEKPNHTVILKHPIAEHPKSVAPLQLLLSVAESRISEQKIKSYTNGNLKRQNKDLPREGVIKKAIVQDGYVHLCKGWKIEDSNVKMKYQGRNVFDAFFSDFSPKTSKLAAMVMDDFKGTQAAQRLATKLKEMAESELMRKPSIFT